MLNKDSILSFVIKQVINLKIKEFGKMLKLNLDSQNKTIEIEVTLLGEKEPIKVNVGSYEIIKEGEKYYLIAKDITTSREWINIMAKNYLENQKIEIPPKIAKTLKIVV